MLKYKYDCKLEEVCILVRVSYKKLWKLLIDKDMKKIQLKERAKISGYNIAKLTNNENVSSDVLARVCLALDCGLDDIMEIIDTEVPEKVHKAKSVK